MDSEEGEDRKHDDDKADQVNDAVHGSNLLDWISNLPATFRFHPFSLN